MKRGLYAVYDKVAQDLAIPMIDIARHEAVAIRNFGEAVMAPKSRLAQNPDDYALVRLGWIIDADTEGEEPNLQHDWKVVITANTVLDLASREHPNAGDLARNDGTVTPRAEQYIKDAFPMYEGQKITHSHGDA